MKCLFAITMAATALLAPFPRAVAFFQEPSPVSTNLNVNSRYRISEVIVHNGTLGVPRALQHELDRLVGTLYRTDLIDELERRLRKDFPGFAIRRTVSKGSQPDQIRVSFDLQRLRKHFDLSSTRFTYNSLQNFTFGAGVDVNAGPATLNFGLLTDNNSRLERSSGYRGGVTLNFPHTSRVRLSLQGESYRSQWDSRTLLAASLQPSPTLYRTRTNIEPTVILDLAPGLELRAGLSFANLEYQFPAASNQAINAVTSTLRYSKQWELGSSSRSKLEAGYDLRAAANPLGSDFSYRRHSGTVEYDLSNGLSRSDRVGIVLRAMLGGIDGRAPLLDRFVLGNTNTLRGWNRFALSPLGGDRVLHFSADGRYHLLRLVYDTGTVYDSGKAKTLRHSLGAGLVISGVNLMIACPLKNGSIEPVFLAGINF